MAPGQYKEIGADHLEITTDGYCDGSARKESGTGNQFFFDAHPTSKAQNVKKKDGQQVQITITDPVTGQSSSSQFTINPKAAQQRGPGARGGGGGIK
jgi:hypothetical protein